MNFQSENIGRFTIESLITQSKFIKSKTTASAIPSASLNRPRCKNQSQFAPTRFYRSSDITDQISLQNAKRKNDPMFKADGQSCIDVVVPIYIDRREVSKKVGLFRNSEHVKDDANDQEKRLYSRENRNFLRKGEHSKHLFQKYLNSKQYRNFHKVRSVEFEGKKNQVPYYKTRQKIKSTKKKACEVYCGLFSFKCCHCNNKGKLDSFNKTFQEILKKRGIWDNYKITNEEKQIEDKIKGYITQKMVDTFLKAKNQSDKNLQNKSIKLFPWNGNTEPSKNTDLNNLSFLKQKLEEAEHNVLNYLENYINSLKMSRKDKLNLLHWSYKIGQVFKKQLVKNYHCSRQHLQTKAHNKMTVQGDRRTIGEEQVLKEKFKQIQNNLFAWERYKDDKGKKGYDEGYKTDMKGGDDIKVKFSYLKHETTILKKKRKKKQKRISQKEMFGQKQNENNQQCMDYDKSKSIKQIMTQDYSEGSQKKNSVKKSTISSKFSINTSKNNSKRETNTKKQSRKNEEQGMKSSGTRLQTKRSKGSNYRASSADAFSRQSINIENITTQSYISTTKSIDPIEQDIQDSDNDLSSHEDNKRKSVYSKYSKKEKQYEQQYDQYCQDEFESHFSRLYKKVRKYKRRNGLLVSNIFNKGQEIDDVQKRQFEKFKLEIRKNRIIKQQLEEILKMEGCEEIIIDEDEGMLNALRKINFIQELTQNVDICETMKQFLKKYIQIHKKNRNIKDHHHDSLTQPHDSSSPTPATTQTNTSHDLDDERYQKMDIKQFLKQSSSLMTQNEHVRLFNLKNTKCIRSKGKICLEGQESDDDMEMEWWMNKRMKRSFGREFLLEKVYVERVSTPQKIRDVGREYGYCGLQNDELAMRNWSTDGNKQNRLSLVQKQI